MTRSRVSVMLVLWGTLATLLMALAAWFGGARGVAYLGLYGLALLPGLPIGWRLFGRRHPAGWVSGALIGYGLTALAFWVPIRLGMPGAITFGLAWALLMVALWARPGHVQDGLVRLPAVTSRDVVAWLLLLHLVVALLALPFGRLGERDADGTRYYRAYFTADFVWHTALTQELARFDSPPRNPFFARDTLHYYWTYFLVPAVLAGPERAPVVGVETALKITATGTALLMFSLVFFAAWSACGRSGPAAAASVLALLAPSFEGLYKIVEFCRRGIPLENLRNLNIDAVTAWDFQGLRIDDLVRSMWYTPQHSTSFALGLVGVLVASRWSDDTRRSAFILTGVALGLSVVMNPLLGAAFCGIYGATALYDRVTGKVTTMGLVGQALAAVPVVLGLAWCVWNQMAQGAAGHLTVGWLYDARHAPVATLFLSLGGLLIPALIGCWPWKSPDARSAYPAMAGVAIGLFLLYFVTLTDRSWVGFRAGNILLVCLPMLAARGLAALADIGWRRMVTVLVAALLLAGAPTTIVDTYNAQDIGNLRMGPGFPWTITLSPAQQAGLAWIRRSTSPDTIVQVDSLVRFRRNWSIIPTFGGRRMAVGQLLPLLPEPHQAGGPERAHAIITALPLDEAHDRARALGIDYVWIDGDDLAALPDLRTTRFRARLDLFTPVFERDEVSLYRVN